MVGITLIAAAIGAAAGAAGLVAFTIGGSAVLGGAVIYGGLATASYLLNKALAPEPFNPIEPNAATFGSQARQTVLDATTPARWVVGRARTGGFLCWYHEEDEDKLHLVFALSEGPCQGLRKIYVDGEDVPVSRANSASSYQPASDSDYHGKIELWFYNGGVTSGPPSSLKAVDSAYWDSEHVGVGLCFAHVLLTQPNYGQGTNEVDYEARFWTGIPTINFVIDGIRITWPGQAVPIWTRNAAAIRYWYETERLDRPASAVDTASFRAAYDVCQQVVLASEPGQDIRYAIDGVISSADSARAVLSDMDFAWQGFVVEVDGKLLFQPGADIANASGKPFDVDQNMIRFLGARPAPALSDRVNAVDMSIDQSSAHDWLPADIGEISDAANITRDGRRLPKNLGKKRLISNPWTASRLMAKALRRSRASATFTYLVAPGENFENLSIVPGDLLLVTDKARGLENYRLTVIHESLESDWSLRLTLREAPLGIYADDDVVRPQSPRRFALPRTSQEPPAPEELAATNSFSVAADGTIRVRIALTWKAMPFETVVTAVVKSSNVIAFQQVATGNVAIIDVFAVGTYTITARHRNSLGVLGPPSSLESEAVLPPLVPPAPSLLSLSVQQGYVYLKFSPVTSSFVNVVHVLYSYSATESPPTPSNPLQNATEVGYLPLAKDSDGNLYASFAVPDAGSYRFFARYVTEHGRPGPVQQIGNVYELTTAMADVDRGPSLFHIQISQAQQTALQAAADTELPKALADLADAETPGANRRGDFVRFYRQEYSDYWVWNTLSANARWERLQDFIGARQISAVNISAITGDFADLDVTGVLSANHISADVRNAVTLWESDALDGQLIAWNTESSISLDDDMRNYESLLLKGLGRGRANWGSADREASVRLIPRKTDAASTSFGWYDLWFSTTYLQILALGARNAADEVILLAARSNDGQTLHLRANDSRYRLTGVMGFKAPAPGTAGPGPGPGPDPSGTTVSANAGSNVARTSAAQFSRTGSATVQNGSGSTTYAWRRKSGASVTLADANTQTVKITPGSAVRTDSTVIELTATNNGVSDTDEFTITWSISGPVSPTTVAADAGADANVNLNSRFRRTGTATVENASGDTTYAWAYVRGRGVSISVNAAPTQADSVEVFLPDPSASNRFSTTTMRFTATNNSVSDSDDVVITWVVTTVSASAGADIERTSLAQFSRQGSATVANASGDTAYAWRRKSGDPVTFVDADKQTVKITPGGDVRSGSTVIELEATNNGVSDVDEFTITWNVPVEAPGVPGTPTRTGRGQRYLDLATTAPTTGDAPDRYRWRVSNNSVVSDSDYKVTSVGPSIRITHYTAALTLQPDTDYWIDVRAENDGGDSAYSQDLQTKTASTSVPDPTTVAVDVGQDITRTTNAAFTRQATATVENGVGSNAYQWAYQGEVVTLGNSQTDTVTITPDDDYSSGTTTIRCQVDNNFVGASDTFVITWDIPEPVELPDASAPTLSVTPDAQHSLADNGDLQLEENTEYSFTAAVTGGVYDTIDYRWSKNGDAVVVSGQGTNQATLRTVSATNRRASFFCRVLVRGNGTTAKDRTIDRSNSVSLIYVTS